MDPDDNVSLPTPLGVTGLNFMESSPEGLLSRVGLLGREDQIQLYPGLVFLESPPLSNGESGLFLSSHATATGTWEPFFQVISSVHSGPYASTHFEQPRFARASWLLCQER